MQIVCFILLVTSIDFAVPTCCKRYKEEYLGLGIDNVTSVTVDVGVCVQCNGSNSSDTNQSSPLPKECGVGRECKPSHTSHRIFHLYNGTITKEIIKECTCPDEVPQNNCTRREIFTTYFEGSSFEQKIDTGECVGVFALPSKQCLVTENRTEVISGPNGRMTVPVIKSCAFSNTCYRAPFKEQHLEMFVKDGQTKERWKTINVGQCKGYCKRNDCDRAGVCNCVPTTSETVTFNSSLELEVKNIFKIIECGCSHE